MKATSGRSSERPVVAMQQRHPFTDYDGRAWADAERARERDVRRRARRLLPKAVREPVSRGGRKVAERAKDVPGAEAVEAALGEALDTATGALAVVAGSTLPTRRILGAYADAGHDVGSIDEIRRLALQRIDEVRPTANSRYLRYVGSGVTSGVAAGVAITGGVVVAASGVGAAPGAGAVLTAMAADAAFTTLAASRAIFESALYHGFDISRPEERIRAMSVLNATTATGAAGKQAAYRQLDQLVNLMVRHGTTWAQLDRNVVALIIKKVLAQQSRRVTQAKLASAIPFAGIGLGATFNARMLSRAVAVADYSYQRWLLIEQYGIDLGEQGVPDDAPFVDIPPEDVQDADVDED